MADVERSGGGNSWLAFLVGALVVGVLVLGYAVYGGGMNRPAQKDFTLKIEAPNLQQPAPPAPVPAN